NRAEGQFLVERELKHGQLTGRATVLGLPDRGPSPSATWVIPVSKTGDAYAVTTGIFPNRPEHPPERKQGGEWRIEVPTLCYPATEDVLRQISAVLTVSQRNQ